MGRAIDMENTLQELQLKVDRLEKAFDGLASTVEAMGTVSTTRTNVDLHEKTSKKKSKPKVVEEATA
jgi:hypothetical protein